MGDLRTKYAAGVNAPLFKALSNPLRHRILGIAGDREVSPKELAEDLDEPFHKVCEHVRAMVGSDPPLLELVGTDTRRGGRQHFYKAAIRPVLDMTDWEQLPDLAKATESVIITGAVLKEIAHAIETGSFEEHPSRIAVRRPLQLDSQGAKEVEEAAFAYDDLCVEAERRSLERAAEGETELYGTTAAMFVFRR